MYKNLSPKALGVSGRQSELIELALTYGFRGLDVDMADLSKRARVNGVSQAVRFLSSANIKVGSFDLPIPWKGDETSFRSQLTALAEAAETAAAVKAHRCLLIISPANDERSFQENFEFHRQRLGQIADVLNKQSIKLGLGFQAARSLREGKAHQFIHQTETLLTLVKTIGVKNVGVLLDSFNWFVGEGTLDQIRDLTADQIVGVRLADYSSSLNVSDIDDSARRLPIDGGAIDCQAIVGLLAQKKYEGPVTMYPHPRSFRGQTRESIVQRASHALEELWRSGGLSKPKAAAAAASAGAYEG